MKKPNCICCVCNKPIYKSPGAIPKNPTCSKLCRSFWNKLTNGKYVCCDNCEKIFYKKKSRISKLNFCCSDCHKEYRSYNINIDDLIDYYNKGMYDNEIAKIYGCSRSLISKMIKKNVNINDRRDKINDINLRLRISKANKNKRTGKENHNYKGDCNYKNLARGLFNAISRMFLAKNNYICKVCGSKSGTKHVHHIKPFYIIIEEFLSINKGISLWHFSEKILNYNDFINENNLMVVCKKCHKEIHYGDNPVLSPFRWESATTIENTLTTNVNGSE